MEDVQYFMGNKEVLLVHSGNISSTIPYFEGALLEDGYMDIYELMKQSVRYDYNGATHVDHAPAWGENVGGEDLFWAYYTRYTKTLLDCVKAELNG